MKILNSYECLPSNERTAASKSHTSLGEEE